MVSKNGWTKEVEEWQQLCRKEELQKTEVRTEKGLWKGQEGTTWKHTWDDHRISMNATLWFHVHEDKETSLEN